MVLPYIDVSHLASSSSYFSAVLQPLGIYYITAGPTEDDSLDSVTFGHGGRAVLRIRQTLPQAESPQLSSIIFTAPNERSVAEFHACALRASPLLLSGTIAPGQDQGSPQDRPRPHFCVGEASSWLGINDGVRRAISYDLDGNRMEVVYPDQHLSDDSVRYTGSAVRKTQSTRNEASRILDWNYGVATAKPITPLTARQAQPSAVSPRRASMSRPAAAPPQSLRRSLTTDVASRLPPSSSSGTTQDVPARSTSSGLNSTTVLGALLGAAAGAAITYGFISDEKSRAPRHEVDPTPVLPRRATFPERPVVSRHSAYSDHDTVVDRATPRTVIYPDVIDDHEEAWAHPRQITYPKYPPSASRSVTKAPPRSREADDAWDQRSRASTRRSSSRTATPRARSEAPVERTPPRDSWERDSHASHVSGKKARSSHSRAHPESISGNYRYEQAGRDSDRDTYVSARTHRTGASRPPVSLASHDIAMRSRADSKVCTGKRGSSRPPSHVSARNVPLPASGVGSSHANWDDDLASVAPSDSISCVGSKTSRRSRRQR